MPLLPTEAALESTAERIARMITRQYGVRVRVEGSLAYVDSAAREIVLPNLSSKELAALSEVLDGFLDHECAHLLFTEFDRTSRLREPVRSFWNAIEDAWIERKMGIVYRGCAENLSNLTERVCAKVQGQWAAISIASKLLFAISCCSRDGKTLGRFCADPEIGDLVRSISTELSCADRVDSTESAVVLAQQIADKILLPLPPVPEKVPEIPNVGIPKEWGAKEEGSRGMEFLGELLMGDVPRCDAEWLFNDCSEKFVPEKGDPEEYLVYSTEFDSDHVFTAKERLDWSKVYRETRTEVAEYIGSMSTMLELALADRAQVRWVGGARKGRKWDRRKLPGWYLGSEDDRVFSRREEGEALDCAVSLLWDCSGSMGRSGTAGSKSYLARLTAVAFHEALLRSQVPHEVLGFNTGMIPPAELVNRVRQAKDRGEDLQRFSRTDEIDNRMVLVPFSGTDGRAICAINGTAANRDGECVLWAARRLAARPERRKILIVGSDGRPQGAEYIRTECRYLKQIVERIIEAGIEVIGIGINDSSVEEFYPCSVVLKKISALPGAVMRELTDLLLNKGARRGSATREATDY